MSGRVALATPDRRLRRNVIVTYFTFDVYHRLNLHNTVIPRLPIDSLGMLCKNNAIRVHIKLPSCM